MRTELASPPKKGGIYISPATISRAIKVLKVSVLEQSWLPREKEGYLSPLQQFLGNQCSQGFGIHRLPTILF